VTVSTLHWHPSPALAPFIQQLWWSKSADNGLASREHVLPTGHMHMVFRLAGPALRVFSSDNDPTGHAVHGPVVGGARSRYYAKEVGASVISVGAVLRPGGAQMLFGVSAADLAERHTPLCDLWGARADHAVEQLLGALSPQQQLTVLESLLAGQLPKLQGLHPAVAQALRHPRDWRVEEWVRSSHYSHRGFIAIFKQATGLSPKRYARLLRFQQLLAALRSSQSAALADLAYSAGYSDQAHMTREFREFAGITPLQYRLQAPISQNHVQAHKAQVNFVQYPPCIRA
jgi:AraC-like DNA-binding protein